MEAPNTHIEVRYSVSGESQLLAATVLKSRADTSQKIQENIPASTTLDFYRRIQQEGYSFNGERLVVNYNGIKPAHRGVISAFLKHSVPNGKLEERVDGEPIDLFD